MRLCGVFIRHILAALVLLRKPLFGLSKRRIQPERYVQCPSKLLGKIVTAASMPP
jgi:hypothetical protein